MRIGIIEGLCLVAAGVAMVELHDSQRTGRPGTQSGVALATAASPAAVAGTARSHDAFGVRLTERKR